jgi:4'-phosphopantetheinyl transferase
MSRDDAGRTASSLLGIELRLQRLAFGECEVRVWTASLEALADDAERHERLLSPGERAQAASMRVVRIAQRFRGGRAALRALLAAELDREPASLRLVAGLHGKPALSADHGERLSFNVAHSAGVVAVAMTREGVVGVDVERRREVRALERLAERALTPEERSLHHDWIAQGASPLDAFLRAWTVKEARLKALGLPIGAGLSRDHPEARALPWQPVAIPDGEDYFGAVAFSSART